jgi:hypothetical protein
MLKILYAVTVISLTANLLLGAGLVKRTADYDRLLIWACEHGNGGHECHEE